MDLQKTLKINIASYLVNTLAFPHHNKWNHRGGPITQTIDNFGLNCNHQRYVENTRKTVISCIEQGVKYTGRNGTKQYVRIYLVNYSSEINLLETSMQNCLGLRYTFLLINCHNQKQGENAVIRSTVNLAFRRLLPKITKNKKMQQGTKNEVKWKEERYLQVKQWLIILNRLPEGK